MKTTLYPALLSMLLSLASASISHAEWGRIQIWDHLLPRVVDAEKTKELKVYGEVAGGPFSDIRFIATWQRTAPGQKNQVVSPVLTPNDGGKLLYAFPIGGAYCGLVRLNAIGKISDVNISTADEYVYVDCDPPRITILKPQEGEVLRPGPQVLELEIKDDALEHYKAGFMSSLVSDKTYTISIDLDGRNVSSNKYLVPQLATDTNKKAFQLPQLLHGRHALRITITDSTGKTDEKTIFLSADGRAPTVNFLSPYDNQEILIPAGGMAAMKITVEATDVADVSSGVEKVEFYVDGKGVGIVDKPIERGVIYSVNVGIPEPGVKDISVKAYDKAGNVRQQSIRVTVIFEGKAKSIGPAPTTPKTLPLPLDKKF